MFCDIELIIKITNLLKTNIQQWAAQKSPIYAQNLPFYSKPDFLNKDQWYVSELTNESQKMSTSGSMSGNKFEYLRWNKFLKQIEGDNHYDLILDEFNIKNDINIAYLLTREITENENYFSKPTNNFMEKHGFTRNATVYYMNKKKLYWTDQNAYWEEILTNLIKSKLDIILAPGPIINSLTYQIKRLNIKDKITNLLSNTCERLLKSDALFLKQNGFVDNICDHMRCWDGGAGFFSCKHYTYHLMDNLSFCEEYEEKLLSTDYFSFPSPFVKYWNGDLCNISNEYKRCKCGRAYRPFKFLQSRPFGIKGKSILEFKEKIKIAGITGIRHVKCSRVGFEIVTNNELSENEKLTLKEIFLKHPIVYVVEND